MELSAKKIFNTLISNVWIIVLSGILLAAAGYAYSYYCVIPYYTTSMKLMVTTEGTITTSSELSAMRRMVNTYVEMLDSRDFYKIIKEAADLDYSPAQLKGMITFTVKEDSEAFTVTVVTADAEECTKIIKCLNEQAHKYVNEKYEGLTITSVESPSTPATTSHTKRNTILSFALGLMLASAFIIIWSEFDSRVKSEEDLTSRYNIPVLGSVPAFDLKKKKKSSQDTTHSHRESTIADQGVTYDEKHEKD